MRRREVGVSIVRARAARRGPRVRETGRIRARGRRGEVDRITDGGLGGARSRRVPGADLVIIDEGQRIEDIGISIKLIHDTYPAIKLLVTGSSSLI